MKSIKRGFRRGFGIGLEIIGDLGEFSDEKDGEVRVYVGVVDGEPKVNGEYSDGAFYMP